MTVFIAWMNFDLGIPTCFYDGMDAYALTWLQFVFPVYVWVLISLIILASRYSTLVTRAIGSNPIAVLATLLLMSYTKLLKTIVQIFSSVRLQYPDNRTDAMWLKDANLPYLQSRHLRLAVVGSIFVATFFLPYTLFLSLGHKLYGHTRVKCIHYLMSRMKPLLDSYYAPYERHTRYWTGLLLLVRCVLYIVFAYDSISGTNRSLLVIIVTFAVLLVIPWRSGRIYKRLCANFIEGLVYLNLICLSAATANSANSVALVYSLVGVVFLAMMGVVLYHFHLQYVAKSVVWLRVAAKFSTFVQSMRRRSKMRDAAPPNVVDAAGDRAERDPLLHSQCNHINHINIITKSEVHLRESLLEDCAKE